MGDEIHSETALVTPVVEGEAAVVQEGHEGKVDQANADQGIGDHDKGQDVTNQDDAEKLRNEEIGGEWEESEESIGEEVESEYTEGEYESEEPKVIGEGEVMTGESELEGEQKEGQEEQKIEEMVEEEQVYEEPPVDPSAPYNFTDSNEALKAPFELRPDQLAEVENLWALYQDYTPAYTDLKDYVTVVELIYMLKCLLLMTYTPEQLEELIEFCVRPPHPEGHINYDQFVKMVTIRQRDVPIEEELRCSLEVMDPERTGLIDREYLRDVLTKQGYKPPPKQVDNLIKEVDMSNDGTIGVEDVVGTLCIDLNTEDIEMLRNQIWPPEKREDNIDDLI